jgi:DNA-binding transcriptional MerR regulator
MLKKRETQTLKKERELPPIPEKIYFTIGEASRLCLIPTYVLRYWEHEFKELSSVKRRSNRRYYQVKDILLIRKIRRLLYVEGYTLEGARQQLLKSNEDFSQHHSKLMQETITLLEELVCELS